MGARVRHNVSVERRFWLIVACLATLVACGGKEDTDQTVDPVETGPSQQELLCEGILPTEPAQPYRLRLSSMMSLISRVGSPVNAQAERSQTSVARAVERSARRVPKGSGQPTCRPTIFVL